jgi:phosphatidylglycerol:prolipoprotein diacylglycerol transferase
MLLIPYPAIDPEVFHLGPYSIGQWSVGPFAVRWYALAYIAGLVIGWRYCLALAKRPPRVARVEDIDDFLVWATLGVVLGGRTGYVLFYNLPYYIDHPIQVFFLWRGGMSFHGGALGVFLAILLFCRQRNINLLAFGDIIACAVPVGLFFGRIANFINDELWGRPTDVPWAMIFPSDPQHVPRHPSQLYEAFLEGVVLFLVLWLCQRRGLRLRPGAVTGVFLIGTTRVFFGHPLSSPEFLPGGRRGRCRSPCCGRRWSGGACPRRKCLPACCRTPAQPGPQV